MTFQELTTVAPFVAAILTAIAIMLVDLVWPNRSALAVGTALIGLAITAGLGLVRSRRAPPKGRHYYQPASGQLIVANDCVAVVRGFASAAESFEDRIRSHRAIHNFAGPFELLALLRKNRHAGVDDLKDVIAPYRETVVGRVTQDRRPLRTLETNAQTIKVGNDLGARPLSLSCLFGRLRSRRTGHVGRSWRKRRVLNGRDFDFFRLGLDQRPERW